MSSDPVFVGCDDGYAMIKMVWRDPASGELRTFSCPSSVSAGAGMTDLQGRSSQRAYVTSGKQYTVMPRAEARDTRFEEYPTSNENRVLVHHALRTAGLWGHKVNICTGLPPGDYFRSAAGVNDALVKAKVASLRKPVRALSEEPPVEVDGCFVCPEGVAAAFDHAVSDDGEMLHEIGDGGWTVVDIGGATTDVVTLVWDGAFMIDHERTGTLKAGVLKARDMVVLRFCDENDVQPADVGGQDQVMERKILKIYGVEHDVSRHIESAIEVVGEELSRHIQRTVGRAARMDKILIVGGGAEVFRSIAKQYPAAVIPQLPAFANARGMFKFAMSQVAEEA